MRNLKKLFLLVLCLFMIQPVILPKVAPTTVEAAAKKGLVKEGKNYYYYVKGKKVKNVWKTVTVKNVKYKYYFGKTGAAYKAPKDIYTNNNMVVKKISGKYYGFDNAGRMVTGVWATDTGKVYYFSAKGVYNADKTKAIRKVIAKNDVKGTIKALGKWKKHTESNSCMRPNSTDVVYDYDHVTLTIIRDNKTGKEEIYEVCPRFKKA